MAAEAPKTGQPVASPEPPIAHPKKRHGKFVLDHPYRDMEKAPPPAVQFVGQGRLRKIAIVGGTNSIHYCPFNDTTWEIWAHASIRRMCPRVDRYFDLHPPIVWRNPKPWDTAGHYTKWIHGLKTPIYMHNHYAEVPASVRYPKERILTEFGRFFANHAAWMVALALTEGVTHLGLYGVEYGSDMERVKQRGSLQFILGVAWGRGIQIVTPPYPNSSILLPPGNLLYGYESHPNGRLHDAYRHVPKDKRKRKAFDPTKLLLIDMKDTEKPRPPLRQDLEQPPDWARSGHPLPKLQPDGTFKFY